MKRRLLVFAGVFLLISLSIIYIASLKPPLIAPADAVTVIATGNYGIEESGMVHATQGSIPVKGKRLEHITTAYTRILKKKGYAYLYDERVEYRSNGWVLFRFEIHAVLQGGEFKGYAAVNGTKYDINSPEWQNLTGISLKELAEFIKQGYLRRIRGILEKSQFSEKTSWLDINRRIYEGTYSNSRISCVERFSRGRLSSVQIKMEMPEHSEVNISVQSA